MEQACKTRRRPFGQWELAMPTDAGTLENLDPNTGRLITILTLPICTGARGSADCHLTSCLALQNLIIHVWPNFTDLEENKTPIKSRCHLSFERADKLYLGFFCFFFFHLIQRQNMCRWQFGQLKYSELLIFPPVHLHSPHSPHNFARDFPKFNRGVGGFHLANLQKESFSK